MTQPMQISCLLNKSPNLCISTACLQIMQPMQISCMLCKSTNPCRSAVGLQITQPIQISCLLSKSPNLCRSAVVFFANYTIYADQLFLCQSNNICRSAGYFAPYRSTAWVICTDRVICKTSSWYAWDRWFSIQTTGLQGLDDFQNS